MQCGEMFRFSAQASTNLKQVKNETIPPQNKLKPFKKPHRLLLRMGIGRKALFAVENGQ